ncbi:MAG: hypothetical protein QOI63_727 [Thermoplasmata archaeon]|jgi:hypothetical protein|nr:hypothetical protein [Thermoplasmata archaeon]
MGVKANRGARRDADAVSPVVGTLMAVLIVVVMAGALFLMSKLFFRSQDATPTITYTQSGTGISIATAPTSPVLDWTDLRPSGTCAGHVQLTPVGGSAGPYPTAAGTKVKPNDHLDGCAPGETLTVVHIHTNRVVFQATF